MLRVKRLGKNEIADNRDHRSENVRLSTLWRFPGENLSRIFKDLTRSS